MLLQGRAKKRGPGARQIVKGGKEEALGHGSKDQEGRVGGGFTGASYSLSITAVEIIPVQSTPMYVHAVMEGSRKVTCDNSICYKLGQVRGGIAVPEVALKKGTVLALKQGDILTRGRK
jgi:hypothetical protein